MSRGVGLTPWLTDTLGPLAAPFALVTQLADFWFAALTVVTLYWLGQRAPLVGHGTDRRRTTVLLALVLGAAGLTMTLKAAFALPRPPTAAVAPAGPVPAPLHPVYEWAATADGFGFPSGHTVTAVVLWGGFAWALDVGSRRQRAAVAGVAVALVAVSRLALGVHYLVDVVAGLLVGLGYLAAVTRLGRPGPAFALAAVVTLPAPLLSLTTDTLGVAGLVAGATLAWLAARGRPPRALAVAAAAVGLAALSLLAVDPFLAAVLGVATAGGALVVAVPAVAEKRAVRGR